MHDEADLRLHRSAGEQTHSSVAAFAVELECLQQFRHRQLPDRAIDGDAECTILVVLHHQDHRMAETWIGHLGRRHQKLSGKRSTWLRVLALRPRNAGQRRRHQQDAEPQHDTPGPQERHRPCILPRCMGGKWSVHMTGWLTLPASSARHHVAIEMPGRVPEDRQDNHQADEQRQRSEHQTAGNDQAP